MFENHLIQGKHDGDAAQIPRGGGQRQRWWRHQRQTKLCGHQGN